MRSAAPRHFVAQVRRKLMSMHVDKELRGNEKSGIAGKGELFYYLWNRSR